MEQYTPLTFREAVLKGRTAVEDVDDWVDNWHAGWLGKGQELRDVLGLTHQEYERWMHDPALLKDMIVPTEFDARGNLP